MMPKKTNRTQTETMKALTVKTFHGDSKNIEQPNQRKVRSLAWRLEEETSENYDNNNVSLNTLAVTKGKLVSVECCISNISVEPSYTVQNNNNRINIEYIKETSESKLLLDKLFAVEKTKMLTPNTDYTEDDLKCFLLNSSIDFGFDISAYSTEQLFRRFIDVIYKMNDVTVTQLVDLYSLGIIMQSYKPLETLCSSHRSELLDAVAQLPVDIPSDLIQFIGTCLSDRFVIGNGMIRMERVVKMQHALLNLIVMGDLNRQIAMSVLLATFVKVSGQQPKQTNSDIISQTFEMIKLIDWMQMCIAGNVADMFILVRCFSLILNTAGNRNAHTDWNTELGHDIYNYFMRVLSAVRHSPNYDYFEMMVERYVAFAIISNAKNRTNLH